MRPGTEPVASDRAKASAGAGPEGVAYAGSDGEAGAGSDAGAAGQRFNFSLFLFSYYAHVGTFAIYATLFFAARGMSAPQIGVLMSLIQVMRIVGPNLWGWVADLTGQRVLVLRLIAFAAIAAFCGMFFAATYTEFIAVMVLINLFTSAHGPLADALIMAGLKGRLHDYGRIRMWGSIGFIGAVLGTGYLLEWLGVARLPWIAGALLLAVALASLRLDAAPAPAPAHAAPALWGVLRQPAVLAFFASAALMAGVHMSLNTFYSLYLAQAGYSKPLIGAMWALGVLAEVAFFYFQAPLFERFGARRVMLCAFGAALLRFALIGVAGEFLWLLVLAQLMHAATFAAHLSAAMIVMQRWFAGPLLARGQALYMSLAYGVGGTLGGLAMSLCWDRLGAQAVYYLAALMALAGGAAAWLSFRWQGAQAARPA